MSDPIQQLRDKSARRLRNAMEEIDIPPVPSGVPSSAVDPTGNAPLPPGPARDPNKDW